MSDDKSKCLANVCVCSNGVASSGEKCASDGGKMCDSCGDGFKLKQDKTACEGMLPPCCVVVRRMLDCICIIGPGRMCKMQVSPPRQHLLGMGAPCASIN